MSVRAIRGAIQVDADTREDVLEGSAELVTAVLERNQLSADDIISILFTATPDLTAEFPAYAARLLGLTDVPLMCASEIAVPGAMPRVLRLLRTAVGEVQLGNQRPGRFRRLSHGEIGALYRSVGL